MLNTSSLIKLSTIEYVRRLPWVSERTIPLSFKTAKCCDTTGCGWFRQAHNSPTQGSVCREIRHSNFRRTGWPQTLSFWAASSTAWGLQSTSLPAIFTYLSLCRCTGNSRFGFLFGIVNVIARALENDPQATPNQTFETILPTRRAGDKCWIGHRLEFFEVVRAILALVIVAGHCRVPPLYSFV